MNLFRSEEHVKNWSSYDPISEEAIMPLADWALLLAGQCFVTVWNQTISRGASSIGTIFPVR